MQSLSCTISINAVNNFHIGVLLWKSEFHNYNMQFILNSSKTIRNTKIWKKILIGFSFKDYKKKIILWRNLVKKNRTYSNVTKWTLVSDWINHQIYNTKQYYTLCIIIVIRNPLNILHLRANTDIRGRPDGCCTCLKFKLSNEWAIVV